MQLSSVPFCYNDSIVRAYIHEDGETWWVLADVCKVLGIQNQWNVSKRLDDDEKQKIPRELIDGGPLQSLEGSSVQPLQSLEGNSLGPVQSLDGVNGNQVTIINESGLYSVMLRSNKPEVKPFKRWVTHEVLPSIRRTGKYVQGDTAQQAALTEPKLKHPVCDVPGSREAQKIIKSMSQKTDCVSTLLEMINKYRAEEDVKGYSKVLVDMCADLMTQSFHLKDLKYKLIEEPR